MIKREKTFYNGGGHLVKQREDIAKITRAYWGCVSLIDKNVGKMIQCLKDTGIYDDTLIIFTTDHGEYMGAHGMMSKGGVLWEEYVNLPFIARYGDHIKKQESDALFSFVDVVPTLIDFAGVTNDLFTVDGISQKAVFEGEKKELRDLLSITHATNQLSCEIPDQECIITKDGMKLVYFAKSQYGQLYDLKNDPHEEHNLYSDPAYKEILNKLKLQLLDELITHRGRDAQLFATHADRYSSHILTYDFWKKEFDELELL